MRLRVTQLLLALTLTLGAELPAQAQVSQRQVGALVEALRQAAPQTGRQDDGLYSDWQIKPENIPRWSRSCIGRELSPAEFEASLGTARTVLACVITDVLQEEYGNSGGDEAIAVRRAASWWMTGDPSQFDSGSTADYTQRVLNFYRQQQVATTAPAATAPTLPVFDRYMQAGYDATNRQDYPTALLYFRRALDERPNNPYAEQAIQNVERYLSGNGESSDGSSDDAQP